MSDVEPVWKGLNAAQADGLACVVCGVDYLDNPGGHAPVGRSVTGSQVFACLDSPNGCAGRAAADR